MSFGPQDEKEKLLKEVREFVHQRPGESGDILRAVADGMADFEVDRKLERNALASNAIRDLMGFVKTIPKDVTIPWLIDTAFHQFPTGIRGHAPVEIAFWKNFLEVARVHGCDKEWLAHTKGAVYHLWWTLVVEPALVNEEAIAPTVPGAHVQRHDLLDDLE